MSRRIKNITLKEILSAALALVLILGVVGGCIALTKIDTKTVSSLSFNRGDLTEQGTYLKSDTAIYTEDLFECQGLTVTLDFESNLEYRVFYYREDKSIIDATERLKEDYSKSDSYANAKYARIVVYPFLEKNEKIGAFDVNKHARMLTIKVNKDQAFEAPLVQSIPGINEQLIFASSFPVQVNNGPFAYQDLTIFEKKTIRRIGVPVKLIKDVTEDAIFTVYVVSGNGNGSFNKIQEVTLTIPANTFTEKPKVTLDNIDVVGSTYNYLYSIVGDEVANYSIIDEWVYFDVDITVSSGQTLGFFSSKDDILFAYHNGLADEDAMDMYITIFSTPNPAPMVEFYIDVLYLE